MPIPEFDARKTILPLMLGVVFLVVGVVVSNITYGIGTYVLYTTNESMGGQLKQLINPSSMTITGTVFTIAGVALIGVAIGIMINYLIAGVGKSAE